MLFHNPVEGPRIVPFGTARLPTDKLPDGHISFRVTQRFNDPDFYWTTHDRPDAKHHALDMGDTRCGDKVLAANNGKAITGIDSAGAHYIIMDHGGGWITWYWHLSAWKIPTGKWVAVRSGQWIGNVGDTGLGAVCHLHFEVRLNGKQVDPWLYLIQNNPNSVQETDVETFGGADLINDPKNFVTLPGARFRSSRTLGSSSIIITLDAGISISSGAKMRGASATVGGKTSVWWREAWLYVKGSWKHGYLHELTVIEVEEATPTAEDPRVSLALQSLSGVATALDGALQAVQAGASNVDSLVDKLKETK